MPKRIEEDCICMPIAWPETFAKGTEPLYVMLRKSGILKNQYFRVGHAALMLIHKKTGIAEYFDFGRYTTRFGWGRVRGAATDPSLRMDVRATFDKQGFIRNAEEISDYLFERSHDTHGDGEIYFSFYYRMNYDLAKAFIKQLQEEGSQRYTTFTPVGINCSRFVCGTLLAGGTRRRDKVKLLLTPTLRASPVGNVIDMGYQSGVFYQKEAGSELQKLDMGRMDNLALLYRNMKGSFTNESDAWQHGHFYDIPEHRPHPVPPEAQWLGGQGEGNWVVFFPLSESIARVTAYYPNGRKNYDIIVEKPVNSDLDFSQPYQLVHDCTRIFSTVEQQGKLFRLSHKEDVLNNILKEQ